MKADLQPMKDAGSFYEVERREYHAQRPGFRINELQISPKQQVPGITTATSRTPSTCCSESASTTSCRW